MVRYVGPLPRISVPGNPSQYVEQNESCEVPKELELGSHWKSATKQKKSRASEVE